MFNFFTATTFQFDNNVIVDEFFYKIKNISWIEKKIITRMTFDEIKQHLFYKDEEIKKIQSHDIDLAKQKKENQMIYIFQAKKDLKNKIKIIENLLIKYKHDNERIDKIVMFFEKLKQDYQNKNSLI